MKKFLKCFCQQHVVLYYNTFYLRDQFKLKTLLSQQFKQITSQSLSELLYKIIRL